MIMVVLAMMMLMGSSCLFRIAPPRIDKHIKQRSSYAPRSARATLTSGLSTVKR